MLSVMDNNELIKLISKYLSGKATIQEAEFVERYYGHFDLQNAAPAFSEEEWQILSLGMRKAIEEKIEKVDETRLVPLYRKKWFRYAAAASIIFLVTIGSIVYMRNKSSSLQSDPAKGGELAVNDILPGGNKATLTLANGSIISLDSAKNGRLAEQDQATILKVGNGLITYDAIPPNGHKVEYNSINIPKGGQYGVTLPDGSKVLLNSISSMRFPTAFNEKNRVVELTSGEAYFEVAKDIDKPFIVKVGDVQIKVLGTHFNIMSYDNESVIKTTLLEGSIELDKNGGVYLLGPGQQAQIDKAGNIKVLDDVDLERVSAWRNGLFYFEDDDIKAVMRQLERWYDITVDYQGAVPKNTFTGQIQRDITLSRLLENLANSNVHLSIEGRKVVVKP